MATLATTPVILGVLSNDGNDYGFVYRQGTVSDDDIDQNDVISSIEEFRKMVNDGEARPVGLTGYADLENGTGIYDEKNRSVNKDLYEVYQFTNGHYGICEKSSPGRGCVFGGDSANEDDYNLEYIQGVFEKWDGKLELTEKYGWTI